MIRNKNLKTVGRLMSGALSRKDHERNPAYQRVCPICGLEGSTKYLDEQKRKWVYKHTKFVRGKRGSRISVTSYCEADR